MVEDLAEPVGVHGELPDAWEDVITSSGGDHERDLDRLAAAPVDLHRQRVRVRLAAAAFEQPVREIRALALSRSLDTATSSVPTRVSCSRWR